jgi:hypothetical protein
MIQYAQVTKATVRAPMPDEQSGLDHQWSAGADTISQRSTLNLGPGTSRSAFQVVYMGKQVKLTKPEGTFKGGDGTANSGVMPRLYTPDTRSLKQHGTSEDPGSSQA